MTAYHCCSPGLIVFICPVGIIAVLIPLPGTIAAGMALLVTAADTACADLLLTWLVAALAGNEMLSPVIVSR